MRRENLLSAPPVGSLSHDDQIVAFKAIWTTYSTYVTNHKKPPRPNVIMSSYQEILNLLPEKSRKVLGSHHDQISDLAQRYCLVEAHLDFNIANVLVDDDLWLIDLEDAGLQLPALYDVINFAFNEVYELRDAWMINLMLSPDFQAQRHDMMSVAVIDGRVSDFETALLINFVLRESSLVSSLLLNSSQSDEQARRRVLKNWELFEKAIPSWNLDGANTEMESNDL
jgi:thiamine kinase-like enzyme